MENGLKILIADDREIFRIGLRALLTSQQYASNYESTSWQETIDGCERNPSDLVIMRYSLPGIKSAYYTENFPAFLNKQKVLFYGNGENLPMSLTLLRKGARGYFSEKDDPSKLITGINKISKGEFFFPEEIMSKMLVSLMDKFPRETGIPSLSQREQQIFYLISDGMSTKEIASSLNLSFKTVEGHRANIKTKITSNVAVLTRLAVNAEEQGLRVGVFA